jgi:DNA-binding NtrC family response regulator
VFVIHLPPLRERKEDIPALATHFLHKHTPAERQPLSLAPGAVAALLVSEWPGNIRELENAIVRGVHLSQTAIIEAADLGLDVDSAPLSLPAALPRACLPALKTLKQQTIEVFERNYLTRLLCLHHGNVSHAARTAGKERRELGKLLKKYQIDPKHFYAVSIQDSSNPPGPWERAGQHAL